jgi:hypothetical protein
MAAQLVNLDLQPLLTACRQAHTRSLWVFGSAASRPLPEVTDLDLHLVVSHLDRLTYGWIVNAAEDSMRRWAAAAGLPWWLELRHGPFKPAPGASRIRQLHLIVDDLGSLEVTPWALRLQRAVTGRCLLGTPALPAACSATRRLREARRELLRWRDALMAREIPFRWWQLDPDPRLVEDRIQATTAWELRCLLRAASISSDLHFCTVVPPGHHGEHSAAMRPLLDHVGAEHRRWQLLPEHWDSLASRAVGMLDRRLEHLSRLRSSAVRELPRGRARP